MCIGVDGNIRDGSLGQFSETFTSMLLFLTYLHDFGCNIKRSGEKICW